MVTTAWKSTSMCISALGTTDSGQGRSWVAMGVANVNGIRGKVELLHYVRFSLIQCQTAVEESI